MAYYTLGRSVEKTQLHEVDQKAHDFSRAEDVKSDRHYLSFHKERITSFMLIDREPSHIPTQQCDIREKPRNHNTCALIGQQDALYLVTSQTERRVSLGMKLNVIAGIRGEAIVKYLGAKPRDALA